MTTYREAHGNAGCKIPDRLGESFLATVFPKLSRHVLTVVVRVFGQLSANVAALHLSMGGGLRTTQRTKNPDPFRR